MFFEEFQVGQKFPVQGRTITETDVVLFSTMTGAYNPLFLNEEYARGTVFKGRVVPGMLTLAMGPPMFYQRGILAQLVALVGVDGVRFPAPVRIGDTLNMVVEVAEKRPGETGRGLVVFRGTMTNQRGETVMAARWSFFIRARAT